MPIICLIRRPRRIWNLGASDVTEFDFKDLTHLGWCVPRLLYLLVAECAVAVEQAGEHAAQRVGQDDANGTRPALRYAWCLIQL